MDTTKEIVLVEKFTSMGYLAVNQLIHIAHDRVQFRNIASIAVPKVP